VRGHTVRTVGPLSAPNDRGFPPTAWHQIDWRKAERRVQSRRLRIFRATQEQQRKQVRNLTKLLLRSYANVLVSVRRITQVNRGKHTPGIDGELATTPDERAKLVDDLRHYQPWKAAPVRRVYIPKANGKQRPLGIPTLRDRVIQMVVKNALEPRFEAECEAQSYGFRPGRCCQEAIEEVYVALNNSAVGQNQYILDADIHGAFDHISQAFLLHRLGPLPGRALVKQWLKAGYWEQGRLHHTTEGTPQGGVISPLLANIALDGLAKRLGKGYRVARYADDTVVMAKSLHAIEQACAVVTAFLSERGLALNQDKTRIVHRTEGFDFLGFHVQMRGQKLLITPQKQKVQKLLQEVRSWLKTHQAVSAEVVIRHLNPLLRGWAMYYRHVVSKQTFQKVDFHIGRALWHWAKRQHPKKPKRWIYRRYFEIGKYGATFYAESQDRRGKKIRLRLDRMPAIPIVRHVKVKGNASPDDPTLQAYWKTRRLKMGRHRWAKGSTLYGIAEAQRWQCPDCGQALFDGQEVHLHHRIPVHAGGSDKRENLQWLHAACHRQRHRQGVTAGQSA
jgi:RNA-directed DNA polymerase